MIRRLLVCGVIVLLCAPLGCGRKRDPRAAVTVTFWHSFVASTRPVLDELLDRFEREHPGIHVQAQYVPTGDGLIQKLVTAIRSRTAPDIAWIHADFLDKLVESHAILPLDSLLSGPNGLSPSEISDIVPASLDAGRWQGTIYALPMEATSLALIYNRDHFRAAGLDPYHPPATWGELLTDCRRLTADTDGDGRTDRYGFFVPVFPASGELNVWMILQWTPWLWQAGGTEFSQDGSRAQFNGTAGVQALALWKTIYDELDFSRFGLAHDLAFASGKVSMVMDGPWNLPRYRELKDVDWAVAPLPAGPAGRATYVAGELLAIFRQSAVPDSAWAFVKWALQPENQAFFSMKSGYLPVRKSVRTRQDFGKFLERDSAFSAFVGQMDVGRARAIIPRHRVEINRAIAEAIECATLGKGDPQKCLNDAARKADDLLRTP